MNREGMVVKDKLGYFNIVEVVDGEAEFYDQSLTYLGDAVLAMEEAQIIPAEFPVEDWMSEPLSSEDFEEYFNGHRKNDSVPEEVIDDVQLLLNQIRKFFPGAEVAGVFPVNSDEGPPAFRISDNPVYQNYFFQLMDRFGG